MGGFIFSAAATETRQVGDSASAMLLFLQPLLLTNITLSTGSSSCLFALTNLVALSQSHQIVGKLVFPRF